MFRITRSKGFHITFHNGWTISVQFGIDNYCGKYPYNKRDFDLPCRSESWCCPDAEVAIWYLDRDMYDPDGWQSPFQVADLITLLANDVSPFYHGA